MPFAPAAVYRNDTVAADAALNAYDVYYYSASARTVWIYSRKAAGRITAVSPSASAPTSVTVAGTSYTLASSAAASGLSSLNGGGVGQVVTLLLGMNNEAVAVLTGEEADSVFYGVVQTASRSLTEENGADVLQSVQVACTDGVTRTVNVDKSLNFPTGWLVKITVNADGENVETLSSRIGQRHHPCGRHRAGRCGPCFGCGDPGYDSGGVGWDSKSQPSIGGDTFHLGCPLLHRG